MHLLSKIAGVLGVFALVTGVAASSMTRAANSASDGGSCSNVPKPYATTEQFRDRFEKCVGGKTVAWVPLGMGTPLMAEWTYWIRNYANAYGMKFKMRDPNWDPTKQVAVVQAFINEKPDVLIVHNLDTGLVANLLKQANEKGIFVLQVNMESNYKSDAFVGGDAIGIGRLIAQDMVAQCGAGTAPSHEIALVAGDPNSGWTQQAWEGAGPVFKQHPEIKIVAHQFADWQRSKAYDISSTILKQHPNLCAIWSDWDQMAYGAARAVKAAGLESKVKVFTADSSTITCQGIGEGVFYQSYGYNVPEQGRQLMTLAAYLLQSGKPPGSSRTVIYAPVVKINRSNWNLPGMCYDGTGRVITVQYNDKGEVVRAPR
jgi:ABC-type sugar transport system substrate-binding protein